jgi:hypothetical protein
VEPFRADYERLVKRAKLDLLGEGPGDLR